MTAGEKEFDDRLMGLLYRCQESRLGVVPFMSGEIRTHLNGVLGALEFIEQNGLRDSDSDSDSDSNSNSNSNSDLDLNLRMCQVMYAAALGLLGDIELLSCYFRFILDGAAL